jgi:hypothetical protein
MKSHLFIVAYSMFLISISNAKYGLGRTYTGNVPCRAPQCPVAYFSEFLF